MGCGGIAPFIVDLDTRWRWVDSFTLQSLYTPMLEPLFEMALLMKVDEVSKYENSFNC